MLETIYCKTCGLHSENHIKLAEDIRKWIPQATVYIQNNPCRIIVCRGVLATVINDGDVFSFVQRSNGEKSRCHDIVNHSERQYTVKVNINDDEFLIETFVYKVVGDTENVKFRLTCLNEPNLSGDFDDYESVKNRLNAFLWEAVDSRCL